MSKIQKIKGFADLFPPDSTVFSRIEETARCVFSRYGYTECRVPILEKTALFSRSIGEETDVVQKEMYTFSDRKDRSLTMRPEATAGVIRAYVENKALQQDPSARLFTYGPMFRYERPQKGRMRQFHQIDAELIGPDEAAADAEVILMLWTFLQELGLPGLSLHINTLGCKECRPGYLSTLQEYFSSGDTGQLCDDCRRRIESNPLRVLDCKVPGCQDFINGAPSLVDSVCAACSDNYTEILSILESNNIAYVPNKRLVRGLDYYVRTTFEVVSGDIGSQSSVAGGGRYDGLVAILGGPDVPATGFACGMERLALLMQQPDPPALDFFIAVLTPQATSTALLLAQELRNKGLAGVTSFSAKSMKSQMRAANKLNAKYTLLLGESELSGQKVAVKNMHTGEQREAPLANVADFLRIDNV